MSGGWQVDLRGALFCLEYYIGAAGTFPCVANSVWVLLYCLIYGPFFCCPIPHPPGSWHYRLLLYRRLPLCFSLPVGDFSFVVFVYEKKRIGIVSIGDKAVPHFWEKHCA